MRELISILKSSDRLAQKETIQNLWDYFPGTPQIEGEEVLLGDDAAAVRSGDEYLLVAGEGAYPELIEKNPYLAGRTSVLANVNDIYAMGGRPLAILDVLISSSDEVSSEILRGIKDNAARYNVPVVGGHISSGASHSSLSVFILGKAKRLLTSYSVRAGDELVFITNPRGKFISGFNFWDSSSMIPEGEVTNDLELLAETAEEGLSEAGKDVSMAGLIGSLLMLLECSSVGAEIYIDLVPRPGEVALAEWLLAFPSFGFVLSVRPENLSKIKEKFQANGLKCEKIGTAVEERRVSFTDGSGGSDLFWDFEEKSFIGADSLLKVQNGKGIKPDRTHSIKARGEN